MSRRRGGLRRLRLCVWCVYKTLFLLFFILGVVVSFVLHTNQLSLQYLIFKFIPRSYRCAANVVVHVYHNFWVLYPAVEKHLIFPRPCSTARTTRSIIYIFQIWLRPHSKYAISSPTLPGSLNHCLFDLITVEKESCSHCTIPLHYALRSTEKLIN